MPKGKPKDPILASKRMRMAALSRKQMRFVEEYAHLGNASAAARKAGYRDGPGLRVTATRTLANPNVKSAIDGEIAVLEADYGPNRVKRRLHDLSHSAEEAGHFGPAVRCEELLGKAAGMWIEVQLSADLNDTHIAALIEIARERKAQVIDNRDSDDD